MAKPDTDDGWLPISNELFAALMVAEFRLAERVVIHAMLDQLYGLAKPRAATISPTDLATRAVVDKGNICKAIRDLIAAKVIARSGDGYRFLKDYDAWVRPGGGAVIGPGRADYCRAHRPIKASKKDGGQSTTATVVNQPPYQRSSVVTQPPAVVNQPPQGGQSTTGAVVNQPPSHKEERVRDEIKRENTDKTDAGDAPSDPGEDRKQDPLCELIQGRLGLHVLRKVNANRDEVPDRALLAEAVEFVIAAIDGGEKVATPWGYILAYYRNPRHYRDAKPKPAPGPALMPQYDDDDGMTRKQRAEYRRIHGCPPPPLRLVNQQRGAQAS